MKKVATPETVREEIESIPRPDCQIFFKWIYVLCARSAEGASVPCANEKAYGTVGKDYAWITEYQPQSIDGSQLAIAMSEASDFSSLRNKLKELLQPTKIAVFKVPIAKKHLLEGEPVVYRLTAMPWEKKYEPWTQELYNHYQQRGKEPLFPNNRKYYLDYIRVHKIFENFTYPIERYTIHENHGNLSIVPESDDPLVKYKTNKKTEEVSKYTTIPKHFHNFRIHGCRHTRTGEYINTYKITSPIALCSLIGWASRSGPEAMIGRYGNIYEQYESYLPSLLKAKY